MKKLTFTLVVAALSQLAQAQAQSEPSWLRYPALSPDGKTIVFTYKGDLYKVPAAGGTATQLTQHEAHDFMPVWSPDGNTLAFASDRYGNFDVYTVNVNGGEPKRLTQHSASEYPYSFSPDGKTVYFGGARMDAVLGSIEGTVRFYGLTETNMQLEGLDRHLRLIDSYKKLHKRRGMAFSRD